MPAGLQCLENDAGEMGELMMTRADIIITLGKMLTVNQKEVQAVKEAIAILLDTEWRDPEIELPTTDEFVLGLLTGTVDGIRNEHSPHIVDWFDDGEGWALVNEPDREGDNWTVDAWMPIPAWQEVTE